ncbi:MAG TPA: hypothetical protein VGA21_09725 [Cyclobacteriaceae bacterium]
MRNDSKNIYTSVIGGYFDEEFEFYTKLFFEKVEQGIFKMILSDILATELNGAPEDVLKFYQSIPKNQIEYIDQTEDSIREGKNT